MTLHPIDDAPGRRHGRRPGPADRHTRPERPERGAPRKDWSTLTDAALDDLHATTPGSATRLAPRAWLHTDAPCLSLAGEWDFRWSPVADAPRLRGPGRLGHAPGALALGPARPRGAELHERPVPLPDRRPAPAGREPDR
ncbi:hypothetical protein [Curtobacterium sp. MCJR17_043]|uniref:hypothetical protein n=1 Tax=Curtobacterium sp. MCJR17_043 TaxID=2175660 RepID=UPI0024DF7136|nr:hypothetical protein [Curtobacterium sp. MCJR17_043]WIB36404.1 hypothetical protein DEJ15_04445 [Curtobacterium sp. MCJR17_043]